MSTSLARSPVAHLPLADLVAEDVRGGEPVHERAVQVEEGRDVRTRGPRLDGGDQVVGIHARPARWNSAIVSIRASRDGDLVREVSSELVQVGGLGVEQAAVRRRAAGPS